ncbi:hypothetical protein [Stenotrophomonas tumulicola]|uniref:Uncharacterized protein n=1 Tax=Stenotrophomonas tumulicola TaxID=1685415 RepID=A0A7W3FQ20_9GAMM|nr:hypothetical protein [Stenotrophomonas tumulicola]MBA8683326.1 hypothetical protein [Stenotrophomonas tumulicola]
MNHLKTLVTSAALAFAFAIPAANAQNAPGQDRGVADCALQFVQCLTGGGSAVTCGIAFAQCLASGGAAAGAADRRED